MRRTVKCQKCGISDTRKEEMMFETVGVTKPVKKYYHKGDCWKRHLKEKDFKEKEAKELDKLVEVIKKIYGVNVIPHTCYPYLQDLRNGTKFFGKNDYKYKKGYAYDLIAECFEYCSDTIEYWNSRKSFNGFSNALRYGLAIVCDKLSVVEQRRKNREQQQAMAEKHISSISNDEHEYVNSFKKKEKSDVDITDFLD